MGAIGAPITHARVGLLTDRPTDAIPPIVLLDRKHLDRARPDVAWPAVD
jgi:hypothetical protein